LNNKPFEADAYDGLLAQQVVQAAYLSNEENRIVTL